MALATNMKKMDVHRYAGCIPYTNCTLKYDVRVIDTFASFSTSPYRAFRMIYDQAKMLFYFTYIIGIKRAVRRLARDQEHTLK